MSAKPKEQSGGSPSGTAKPGEAAKASTDDFLVFLRQVRKGGLAAEIAEACADAVIAVRHTGKPASVKLDLKFQPDDDGERVVVVDDVKMTIPKAKKGKSLFYTTEDGGLTRTDPNQMEFKLREIAADPEERDFTGVQ